MACETPFRHEWRTISNMVLLQIFHFVIFFTVALTTSPRGCDRSLSRLVGKMVYEKLLPAYSALKTELSDECLFSPARDRYRVQETHKSYDDGKWYCHFCGKAFVSEYFLDLHFDNRHTEQLSQDNAICLADVCEIFRCDIISQKVKADYWDVALCLEDDMKSLHQRCAFMVSSCVPSDLTENETRWLTDVTVQELCSYLTCSKYWDVPFDLDRQDSMAAFYIVLTVFVLFGIIIYYCLCFTYFYTDTFVDAVAYDPMPFTKHPIKPYNPDLRNRARLFPESHPD